MSKIALAAAFALATTTLVAETADAKTIVTGGDVTLTLTYDLLSHNIWGTAAPGAHPATIDADGNPVLKFDIQRSRNNNNDAERYARGSQVVDGGYQLYLNGGAYLFPIFADGSEVENIDVARDENGDPILDADGNEQWERLCCRHELSGAGSGPNGFGLSTVESRVFGNIDGVPGQNRNPANPDRTVFDLVETGAGTYDVIVTEWMASFLNFGFHPAVIGGDLYNAWTADGGSLFSFAGGETIGSLSINVLTEEYGSPAPVPVPAALPLLIGGLGIMGVVGKRRRKAA